MIWICSPPTNFCTLQLNQPRTCHTMEKILQKQAVLCCWIESVPLPLSPANWFLIALADYPPFAHSGNWAGDDRGGAINAAFEVFPAKVERALIQSANKSFEFQLISRLSQVLSLRESKFCKRTSQQLNVETSSKLKNCWFVQFRPRPVQTGAHCE